MDPNLILAKAGSVRSHLNRVIEKRNMVKAVGFRNLMVHEYGKIELGQVYEIAQNDVKDLNEFLKAILKKLGLTD